MLTPQEVSSHAFPKAVMGGYNMSSVDEFLDELTDDYTSLYKENAGLKAKMKVLVEKVEDYRSTEDSMRATLLTAQKMADSIVKEAEQKREQMLKDAEAETRVRIVQVRAELADAEQRLKAGQQNLAGFIASTREICAQELSYLDKLPQLPTNEGVPEAEETAKPATKVDEIEQNVFATFDDEQDVKDAESVAAQETSVTPSYLENSAPESVHDDDPTRRINLSELRFGKSCGKSRRDDTKD
jgi:cell division initiation protein